MNEIKLGQKIHLKEELRNRLNSLVDTSKEAELMIKQGAAQKD